MFIHIHENAAQKEAASDATSFFVLQGRKTSALFQPFDVASHSPRCSNSPRIASSELIFAAAVEAPLLHVTGLAPEVRS